MLKELFESTFYTTYAKKSNVVIRIDEEKKVGEFVMFDQKTCSQCQMCINNGTHKENIHISTDKYLYYVNIEQIFDYIEKNEKIGKCCDYMLANDEFVLFLEMTCSIPKYVEDRYNGKRNKAQNQLRNTIEKLYVNKNVRDFCGNKTKKYVIFSWKNTTPQKENTKDIAEQGFLTLPKLSDATYSIDNISSFDFGFKYKEVRYPNVLNCDKL